MLRLPWTKGRRLAVAEYVIYYGPAEKESVKLDTGQMAGESRQPDGPSRGALIDDE